jgi:hypothetical protein
MRLETAGGVARARWLEAARPSQPRRDRCLIEADQTEKDARDDRRGHRAGKMRPHGRSRQSVFAHDVPSSRLPRLPRLPRLALMAEQRARIAGRARAHSARTSPSPSVSAPPRAITTMSNPSGMSSGQVRKHSRQTRRMRFRTGAAPSFFVVTKPMRVARSGGSPAATRKTKCRLVARSPTLWTRTKSARRVSRRSLPKPKARPSLLLVNRDREAPTALTAAVGQNLRPTTGGHAREESVRPKAPGVVGLVRSFRLRHCEFSSCRRERVGNRARKEPPPASAVKALDHLGRRRPWTKSSRASRCRH